jgi:DNA primase
MISAGLVRISEKNGKPYDYFRSRVMFPIADAYGRVIAFGGRVMQKDEEPKYLNSPDTELFTKGSQLYALSLAREEASKRREIIASEGYMDVIALHTYGYNYAVAPLGTAITENQIQLMWKYSPTPTICLDGDNAGLRAATRAANRVLSILKPGYSLKFAFVTGGKDPDEILRAGKKNEFDEILKNTKTLCDVLFAEIVSHYPNSKLEPQEKANIEKEIADLGAQIKDKSVAGFLVSELKDKAWNYFRKPYKNEKPSAPLKTKTINIENSTAAKLIALILAYPQASHNLLEELIRVHFASPELNAFMSKVIDILSQNDVIDKPSFKDFLNAAGFSWAITNAELESQILNKQNLSSAKAQEEIQLFLNNLYKQNLENEIREQTERLKENYTEELLNARSKLQEELAELSKKITE